MELSKVFSRVRDKQYRSTFIYLTIYVLFLLISLGLLIADYIGHKPVYEQINHIAFGLYSAAFFGDNFYKFFTIPKQFSYALTVTVTTMITLSMFLLFVAAIKQDYPDLVIHWTFYPWTN